jgi:hypothetical protein
VLRISILVAAFFEIKNISLREAQILVRSWEVVVWELSNLGRLNSYPQVP